MFFAPHSLFLSWSFFLCFYVCHLSFFPHLCFPSTVSQFNSIQDTPKMPCEPSGSLFLLPSAFLASGLASCFPPMTSPQILRPLSISLGDVRETSGLICPSYPCYARATWLEFCQESSISRRVGEESQQVPNPIARCGGPNRSSFRGIYLKGKLMGSCITLSFAGSKTKVIKWVKHRI